MVLITSPTVIEIPANQRPNRNNELLAVTCQSVFAQVRDFSVEFSNEDSITRASPNFGTLQFRVNESGMSGWTQEQEVKTNDMILFSPNQRIGVTSLFVWTRLGASIDIEFEAIRR